MNIGPFYFAESCNKCNDPFYLVYGIKVYHDEYWTCLLCTSLKRVNAPLFLVYSRKVYPDEYLGPVYFAQVERLMFLYP